jgi:hypothetical protein
MPLAWRILLFASAQARDADIRPWHLLMSAASAATREMQTLCIADRLPRRNLNPARPRPLQAIGLQVWPLFQDVTCPLVLDTNVLARVFVNDPDDAQAARQRPAAVAALSEYSMVTVTVILESDWVIRGFDRLARTDIVQVLTALLGIEHIA